MKLYKIYNKIVFNNFLNKKTKEQLELEEEIKCGTPVIIEMALKSIFKGEYSFAVGGYLVRVARSYKFELNHFHEDNYLIYLNKKSIKKIEKLCKKYNIDFNSGGYSIPNKV